MADNNDLHSLLSRLQQLEKSKDYLNISTALDHHFHSKINDIIEKWLSNEILSSEEKQFFDFYSLLQLSFVEYFYFNSDTTVNIQTIINNFRINLFKKTQTDILEKAVLFIRDDQLNTGNENDLILVYIMRMLDARSFAYRTCYKELALLPVGLNDELRDCLTDRYAKEYLYTIRSINETNEKIIINHRQRFFIGCCTYAVAVFDANKEFLKNDNQKKYIYLLAKYVRVMLSRKNFEQDNSIIYCLRGILALLNNCVPTENWIQIINKALANPNDVAAQQENPFNIDLFSLIINRLLGSKILLDKTKQSDSYVATSLIDVALIFLNKWFDTSNNQETDDDEDTNNKKSLLTNEPNQVLHLLRSNIRQDDRFSTSQIIIPYIDAKYDRLRLMAISVLSSIMSYKDFTDLQKKKINMAKDIVELLFYFIDRTASPGADQYKGISFQWLLCSLLRFLIQDEVKKQTLPYLSKIINYAEDGHLNALKILCKISTNPDLQKDLSKNTDLKRYLNTDADFKHRINLKFYKYIVIIRENLIPLEPKQSKTSNDPTIRQAFISYCHRDKNQCDAFIKALEQANIFTKIWIDRENMKDNLTDTITKAIRASQVVFVLLSHEYCKSDTCRHEWEFARQTKKQIYPIFVEEDFKKDTCDWALFYIGENLYYRVYQEDGRKNLIRTLLDKYHDRLSLTKTSTVSHRVHESVPMNTYEHRKANNLKNIIGTSHNMYYNQSMSFDNQADDEENIQHQQSIAQWTSEDIQNWCREHKFEQWYEPLANYHGRAFLALHKLLKTDANIQFISTSHRIAMLDVILFRTELDKLVSETTTTHKQPTKKQMMKRRASKSSTK